MPGSTPTREFGAAAVRALPARRSPRGLVELFLFEVYYLANLERETAMIMRRILVLYLLIAPACFLFGIPQNVHPELGCVVVLKNVSVAMRDGVHLATDIYIPAQNGAPTQGRFPAILERTTYNKDGSAEAWAYFFASHGYVCVVQDTRGRYRSEGIWHMMIDDAPDGFDTAAWIVKQPWSNGEFGTVGTSYSGGTQHALAITNPPGLKAIVPVDAVSNAGYFGMRNGGAFEQRGRG